MRGVPASPREGVGRELAEAFIRWLLENVEEPPPEVLADARNALDERSPDHELLVLAFDSRMQGGAVERAGERERVLVFRGSSSAVLLRCVSAGGETAITGQLLSAAEQPALFVRLPGQRPIALRISPNGRFESAIMIAGPLSFRIELGEGAARSLETEWVTVC
jgi:hypothetical protein